MAAKSQHVPDSAVSERRLRPIFEWLDAGNSKKALQEAEKVLKKTPNLHCARALKALALMRLGKEVEAVSIIESLSTEIPSDDATLQAMTICYRETQQLDKICKLYEAAVQADPTNEELHTHLFMSYVRIMDFKSQQKSAMALYKIKPKNPYYFWAVMSIVLQATRGEDSKDSSKRAVLLTLAQRMVDKLISENKIEAEQEVQLYLMILEQQGKYAEALDVLNGPLGQKLTGSTAQSHVTLLIKMEKWVRLNVLCKKLLTESLDRWDVWQAYLTSVFKLYEKEPHINNHTENHENNVEEDNDTPDDSPEKAHEFICNVLENYASSDRPPRGPYLARLELCTRLRIHGDTTELLGDPLELFVEYFRLFGHKACCVFDLRTYLHLLEPERRTELSTRLIKDVGISSTTLPQSKQQMQRHICSLQLSRLCGTHRNLGAEHLSALVTALSLHYQLGTQTYGDDRLPTDHGPPDPYAILSAHILYDVAHMTQSSEPVLLAISLLEFLLKDSPSNFHAKLLCLKLYHVLGGAEGAEKMYYSLGFKHIQLDSLGYAHCSRLPTTGHYMFAAMVTDSTANYYEYGYKDSIDHLMYSYKFGTFLKLDEVMDFREKLNNSLHYKLSSADSTLIKMTTCNSMQAFMAIDILPKESSIKWDKLRYNFDLNVYVSYDPDRCSGPPEQSSDARSLFDQDCEVLRVRANLLWAVGAAIAIVKATDDNKTDCAKELSDRIKNWDELYENILSKNYEPISERNVAFPLPTRLHSHLTSPYRSVLIPMFKLIHAVTVEDTEGCATHVRDCEEAFGQAKDEFVDLIEKQNSSRDMLWDRRKTLEKLVNTIEIASLAVLLIGICYEIAKPPAGKKGKKKAAPSNSAAAIREGLSNLAKALRQNVRILDDSLEKWNAPDTPKDVAERLATLSFSDGTSNSVIESIKSSHITSVKEMRGVLKERQKMLNALIC